VHIRRPRLAGGNDHPDALADVRDPRVLRTWTKLNVGALLLQFHAACFKAWESFGGRRH
jgi:hypothetical protein